MKNSSIYTAQSFPILFFGNLNGAFVDFADNLNSRIDLLGTLDVDLDRCYC